MTELEFNLGELHLKLTLIKREIEKSSQPYLDWLICDTGIAARNFSGQIRWSVMLSELEQLAAKLDQMYANYPKLDKVVFEPVEPNVVLAFEITRT